MKCFGFLATARGNAIIQPIIWVSWVSVFCHGIYIYAQRLTMMMTHRLQRSVDESHAQPHAQIIHTHTWSYSQCYHHTYNSIPFAFIPILTWSCCKLSQFSCRNVAHVNKHESHTRHHDSDSFCTHIHSTTGTDIIVIIARNGMFSTHTFTFVRICLNTTKHVMQHGTPQFLPGLCDLPANWSSVKLVCNIDEMFAIS